METVSELQLKEMDRYENNVSVICKYKTISREEINVIDWFFPQSGKNNVFDNQIVPNEIMVF